MHAAKRTMIDRLRVTTLFHSLLLDCTVDYYHSANVRHKSKRGLSHTSTNSPLLLQNQLKFAKQQTKIKNNNKKRKKKLKEKKSFFAVL